MFKIKYSLRQVATWLVISLLGMASPLLANELQDISFSTLPGNKVQIQLTLAEAIENPASFSTDNPARIALDLPSTTSGLTKKVTTIAVGAARSVVAIESGGRTRVVVNLLESVEYDIAVSGNKVLINVGGSQNGAGSMSANSVASNSSFASRASGEHGVQKLIFAEAQMERDALKFY